MWENLCSRRMCHKAWYGIQNLTCMGNARPIDGRPQSEVQVGPDKLEVVASFCYLGDMLSAGGGCEMAVTTHVKIAWKKFRELLPVLTSRHLSYKTRGHVYSSCVLSAMLHASETWPLTKTNLQRLQRNDRAMIRQICSIKPEDVARVSSSELLAKLQLEDLNLILRERRLRWFGHVERSSGAIRTAYDMQIDGKRGAGRPKQTCKKLTEKDCREWKLTTVYPQERSTWRSGVRSAMCAASQLPGKGPTDVDDAPAPARKSKIRLWWWTCSNGCYLTCIFWSITGPLMLYQYLKDTTYKMIMIWNEEMHIEDEFV